MLTNEDLERLITVKRREIEKEKTALGLSPLPPDNSIEIRENATVPGIEKQVSIVNSRSLSEDNDTTRENNKKGDDKSYKLAENIPAGLERYIRRYIGLPGMLKAGEYSPNNPLIRGERTAGVGDALLGLGEYERRRNTLRKLRQQQYREYLDEQAKKKQDAKEQAERERREREERERQHDEGRERARQLLEQDKSSPEQRRASVCHVTSVAGASSTHRTKVDTGVQVKLSRASSVAVQTDHAELYRISPSPTKSQLTEAERELSPRTVVDSDERPIQPAAWALCGERVDAGGDRGDTGGDEVERRPSYGDFDERSRTLKRSNREKLVSDLRHTYMPSLFDADAIHMRNMQVEKEAAERRQFYQQELKNQILEQQRIREERKTREKMLEQAEMRRLEEQLRMLRAAQEREGGRHRDLAAKMKENATDYEKKRTNLQTEIEFEKHKLFRATTQPSQNTKRTITSHSDTRKPLLFYYPKLQEMNQIYNQEKRPPFSTNITDNSIFSPNYDVDSYLRRNLNPKKETLTTNHFENAGRNFQLDLNKIDNNSDVGCECNVIVEKALVHERPKEKLRLEKPTYEPSFLRKDLGEVVQDITETPIPVLRHSPKNECNVDDNSKVSDGMKLVEDKWKVPAVQKNILKSLPSESGKNVSILTQLGSIRRQLQLEQLKLDSNISSRNSDV